MNLFAAVATANPFLAGAGGAIIGAVLSYVLSSRINKEHDDRSDQVQLALLQQSLTFLRNDVASLKSDLAIIKSRGYYIRGETLAANEDVIWKDGNK